MSVSISFTYLDDPTFGAYVLISVISYILTGVIFSSVIKPFPLYNVLLSLWIWF